MNIVVFLGAKEGKHPVYREKIAELGTYIGESGHTLIYGGSRTGLMGIVAESALQSGGRVIGVEPEFFVRQELQHEGLTQLLVTKDMAERKARMMELGELFIVFPGGTGTLEEAADVISMMSLNHLQAKCIFYNLNGFYEELRILLGRMVEEGFSTKERQMGIFFADSLEEIEQLINAS